MAIQTFNHNSRLAQRNFIPNPRKKIPNARGENARVTIPTSGRAIFRQPRQFHRARDIPIFVARPLRAFSSSLEKCERQPVLVIKISFRLQNAEAACQAVAAGISFGRGLTHRNP